MALIIARPRPSLAAHTPTWVRLARAALIGSALGLGLRLLLFLLAVWTVQTLASLAPLATALAATVVGAADPDPVYTHAVMSSLGDIRIQGLAVGGPPGAWLHDLWPELFVAPARAHAVLVRLAVQPGSALMARLVATALAHAALLAVGVPIVRAGWLRRRLELVVLGLAVQAQVPLAILSAPPSAHELESTGLDFAANALLPWLWQRGYAVTDLLAWLPPALVAAALVGSALVLAYVPAGLFLAARARGRRLTLASALTIVLTSAVSAGLLEPDHTAAVASSAPVAAAQTAALASASETRPEAAASIAALPLAPAPPAADHEAGTALTDRWFEAQAVVGPSQVQVQINPDGSYQLLVNGVPMVIQGMGLNTQYASQMEPSQRQAQLESDMAAFQALGVNTVLGWDPAEFDEPLLDAAARHGIHVILPFDLDPEADYTDPAVRQSLRDQVLAWVQRYRGHSAVLMWGLGNEVLHKIVHPAWVGPQDPARERNAEAFSSWLVETADAIHAVDPDHPVTYRSAEDAFVGWVAAAMDARGGSASRPWFVWGTNCYQDYLARILDTWPSAGLHNAVWVSEFAPGTMAVPDRPDGFRTMWGYIRQHPQWVLGGAIYAWTRNGPEGVDRNFGLTDDGVAVDGRSLDAIAELFHTAN